MILAGESLMQTHEDSLARLMADGSEDLVGELCIRVASECTAAAIARIPAQGLPRPLHRQGSRHEATQPGPQGAQA